MCGLCYNCIFTLWLLWFGILKKRGVYIVMTEKDKMIKAIVMEECRKGGLRMYLKVLALCIFYLIKIEIREKWLFIFAIMCLLGYIFFIK